MDLGLISVRYARALLKASIATKQSELVYNDMMSLADSYVKVPALKATIDNPMLSRQQKVSLLHTAAADTSSELTQRFIQLVLNEGRESCMQFIANSFITLYRKHNNLIRAKLTTAATLDYKTEEKFRQLVASKTNGKVEFTTNVDASLIGGFILEYDTYRMDASVRTQLNSILLQLN